MKPKRKEFNDKALAIFASSALLIMTIIACFVMGRDVSASQTAPEREVTGPVRMEPVKADREPEAVYCCLLDDVTAADKLTSLGVFKVTAYCGCEICCGRWGKDRPVDKNGQTIVYTAYGDIAREGVTVAADPSVFACGTEIVVDGHTYTVQDKGGAVKGDCIDIYFESHEDARAWGVQYIEVFTK